MLQWTNSTSVISKWGTYSSFLSSVILFLALSSNFILPDVKSLARLMLPSHIQSNRIKSSSESSNSTSALGPLYPHIKFSGLLFSFNFFQPVKYFFLFGNWLSVFKLLQFVYSFDLQLFLFVFQKIYQVEIM